MTSEERPPFSFSGDWSGQLVATAIHNGHDLREEVAAEMILDEDDRLREEDPHTDQLAAAIPALAVVHRSRFEVDLNRPRREAVYRRPEDCWNLEVWRTDPLPDTIADGSLEVYDAFYAELGERLDEVAARGPFVVYDVHSYNHRRDGASMASEPSDDEPEINLGTGSVDTDTFGPVVEAFMRSITEHETEDGPLDVRENVKFEGRALSWFIHDRYPRVGCCLALEFKKTYMDEWSGLPDQHHLVQLQKALAATADPVRAALHGIPR